MHRLLKTLIIVIIAPLLATAQKTDSKPHYYNVSQFGWLLGSNQHTFGLQMINGVAIKKYYAGIGVTYDRYGYKSIPVFADLRYSLLAGKTNTLQVYGNAGINNPLYSDELPHKYGNGEDYNTFKKSFYGEAGLTYLLTINDNFCFNVGAGYNYKTFKYKQRTYFGSGVLTEAYIDYTYRYSKYVLRVGFALK